MRAVLTYALALLATLVLQTYFPSQWAHTDEPHATPVQGATVCAPGAPLSVPITAEFQRIKSETPSVLCVFRHKTNGFPTLNIVEEPRMDDTKPPTLAEYEQGVAQGYKAVGLSDTKLSDSRVGQSRGLPFFTTEIAFTNKGTPMVARILVVQYHDRTYTASAIAEAKQLEEGRALIAPLIEGIELDGELVRDTRGPTSVWTIIGATSALLFLVYIGVRSVRTRRSAG